MNDAEVEPRLGSLFTGYGGLDLAAADVYGARPVWHVENAPAPAAILAHHWPHVPNHLDVTAVDWDSVEPVDILTGGFPCQDLSHAGKRLGLRPGTRSGLWQHMAYAIDQLRPRMVVIENVRGLLSANAHSDLGPCPWCVGGTADGEPALRALGAVLGDLAGLGYDAQWSSVRASDVGAPHGRFRVFIVAHPAGERLNGGPGMRNGRGQADALPGAVSLLPTPSVADVEGGRKSRSGDRSAELLLNGLAAADAFGPYAPAIARWAAVLGRPAPSPTEPGKDDRPRLSPAFVEWMMGLPAGHVTDLAVGLTRVQQLKALGNGVVPQQAAAALRFLMWGEPVGVGPGAALLPTPQAHDHVDGKTPEQVTAMRERTGAGVWNLNEVAVNELTLLPTPAVNDMGEGKTPEKWDEWTAGMQARHGNGNGHGKSLAIETQRLQS